MKNKNSLIKFIVRILKNKTYDLRKLENIQKYTSPVNDVLITQQNFNNYMIK